jgi:SHS2 domain-containing protein
VKEDYQTFEHEADMGVRGFGETIEEAFENGARAMFSIILDLKRVDPKKKIMVNCSAPDDETLFVEWLNELLTQSGLREMAFSAFKVEKLAEGRLNGYARGERIDPLKHKVAVEVKGATYSMLRVGKNHRYVAQCVVDV